MPFGASTGCIRWVFGKRQIFHQKLPGMNTSKLLTIWQ